MKVYLSGTLKIDWRESIMEAFPDVEFFDPSTHGLTDPQHYTNWNLSHINDCDVVFAFLSESSSGIGVSAEIGFATVLNKKIILVDMKENPSCKYIQSLATVTTDSLTNGVHLLKEAHTWLK